MRPEAKLQFDRACEALGLDEARRDRAWRQMSDLGLSPDDPTVIFLAVSGVLEKAADAFADLPAQIETTARRVVGPVAKAASEKVRADFSDMSANVANDVAAGVSAKIEERVSAEIAMRRFGTSGVITAAGLIVALLVGLAAWFGGSASGTNATLATVGQWQTIATRNDASTWFALAAANADIKGSISTYCRPGAGRVRTVEGGARVCELPVWLDGSAAPVAGVAAGMRTPLLDWLYGWGPLWLIGTGLLVGLLIRRAVLSFSGLPGVRWLLAG